MWGIIVVMVGVSIVVVGNQLCRQRVRSVFGTVDEWSLEFSKFTGVLPRWMPVLAPSGFVLAAVGAASVVL